MHSRNSGLATYNTFDMHWKPCAAQANWTEVQLDNYKCLDAKVCLFPIPLYLYSPLLILTIFFLYEHVLCA